jgi:predicted HTH transcriptional regulator
MEVPFEEKDILDITPDDVCSLVGRKENQRLDFKGKCKEGDPENKEIAKDICAMANADGGYIVIGA